MPRTVKIEVPSGLQTERKLVSFPIPKDIIENLTKKCKVILPEGFSLYDYENDKNYSLSGLCFKRKELSKELYCITKLLDSYTESDLIPMAVVFENIRLRTGESENDEIVHCNVTLNLHITLQISNIRTFLKSCTLIRAYYYDMGSDIYDNDFLRQKVYSLVKPVCENYIDLGNGISVSTLRELDQEKFKNNILTALKNQGLKATKATLSFSSPRGNEWDSYLQRNTMAQDRKFIEEFKKTQEIIKEIKVAAKSKGDAFNVFQA